MSSAVNDAAAAGKAVIGLKVIFLAMGDRRLASSRARIYSYLPYLTQRGVYCETFSYTSPRQVFDKIGINRESLIDRIIGKIWSSYQLFRVLCRAASFDAVYIQKVVLSPFSLALFKMLNRNLIYDLDDAVHTCRDISHMLKVSRRVVVSNQTLKEMAAKYNSDVRIVPTPVEVPSPSEKGRHSAVILGWIGSPETSAYLDAVMPVIKDLKTRYPSLRVKIMGSGKTGASHDKYVERLEWSIDAERSFLEGLDIGIMPLPDNEWARAKAGYKLLLFMANSCASVASPVGMNSSIIDNGQNGFLARGKDEWYRAISRLIEDEELRRAMGRKAREYVLSRYSYEALLPGFMEAMMP